MIFPQGIAWSYFPVKFLNKGPRLTFSQESTHTEYPGSFQDKEGFVRLKETLHYPLNYLGHQDSIVFFLPLLDS